jgi:hypothetical protein
VAAPIALVERVAADLGQENVWLVVVCNAREIN